MSVPTESITSGDRHATAEYGALGPPVSRRARFWMVLAGVEVAVAVAAVAADLILPTILILLLAIGSMAYRRQQFDSLGLVRPKDAVGLATTVLGLVVAWTALQLGLFMPILEHATGERQDLSMFDDLEGNFGGLLVLLAVSWTLAAFGEELAYRGFVQTRATEMMFGSRLFGIAIAAVLFGLAHTEQGRIGVAVTFLDALFFSYLGWRYHTLWAPILAHGLNNTIGLTAFYFVGPVYGLW